jgi:endonuclease-3
MSNFVKEIFKIFHYENPNPRTELMYKNEFTLLIAIILSAQTTDKMVNKATEEIFIKILKPLDMLNFGFENFEKQISCLNFYKTKARNVFKTCQILLEKYSEKIPHNFDELILLPGVGRKTANVFLGIIDPKKEKRIGIDTHVSRVSYRLGLSDSQKDLIQIENDLIEKIPDEFFYDAHHWLVLHGRYVCKSQKPLCPTCNLKNFCKFYKNSFEI